jgi:predicted nucleic acid-binding protein
MNEQLALVVDASVGIKLFLSEPLSPQADALFSHLAADPPARLYVPDLFYVECANTLWKYVRRFGYLLDSARQDVISLQSLALHALPTAVLIDSALDIAVSHQVTAYDACYVALSQRLGFPLLTADEALVRRFEGTLYDVQWLGAFSLTTAS